MLCWDLKIQCTTIRILGCTLFYPDRFVCLDDGRTVGQEGKSLQMLWGGGGCTIGERVCFGAESSFGRLLLEVWGGVVAELWHGGSFCRVNSWGQLVS